MGFRFLLYIAEVLAGREQHPTLLDIWQRVQASNAVNDVVSGNRRLQVWATSRVLGEIAEDRGQGARVRNWLRNPG